MFPKIVVPKIIHFNRVFHYKPSILGYPYFWKHPHELFNSSSPEVYSSQVIRFVTFSSPIVGGHQQPHKKGHFFTIPKRLLWITKSLVFVHWFFLQRKQNSHLLQIFFQLFQRQLQDLLNGLFPHRCLDSFVQWEGCYYVDPQHFTDLTYCLKKNNVDSGVRIFGGVLYSFELFGEVFFLSFREVS